MKSATPLDYAEFQLSPKRSRCELFVSGDGKTEKLASGLLKPFVTHLTVAEEQVAQAVQTIKLEVGKHKNAGLWFTKGTLERFVRFVSTPEVLELVNTFDAEMSQLEAARRIYSQGAGDQLSDALGGDKTASAAAADITKKELLKAIDVRLVAVKQDLTTACARASAAGFNFDTVSELQLFADRFGAHRLNDACSKYISLNQRRPELLINTWRAGAEDRAVRSSSGSDMSLDDPAAENIPSLTLRPNGPQQTQRQHQHQRQQTSQSQELDATQHLDQSGPSTCQQPKSITTTTFLSQIRRSSVRESSSERDENRDSDGAPEEIVTESSSQTGPARRLSVQDRINLFENKQKEQSGSGSKHGVVGKSTELRRLSSDVSSSSQVVEKAVLRRWSAASDLSVELSNERKETQSCASTPCSSSNSQTQFGTFLSVSESKDQVKDTATSLQQPELKPFSSRADNFEQKDLTSSENQSRIYPGRDEDVDLKDRTASQIRFRSFPGGTEQVGLKDQVVSQTLFRTSSNGAERAGVKDQILPPQAQFRVLSGGRAKDVGLKDQADPRSKFGASVIKVDDVGSDDEPSHAPLEVFPTRAKDVGLRDQPAAQVLSKASTRITVDSGLNSKDSLVSKIDSKALLGKLEGGIGTNNEAASESHYRGLECDPLPPQSKWGSFSGKVEELGKKESVSPDMQSVGFPTKVEDSGLHGMKLQRQSSVPEQNKKLQGRRGESAPVSRDGGSVILGRKVQEGPEMFGSVSTAATEQVQKVRQSKGNQERNDELQMKADELEKLFAAHKLRVPGDQSTSSRRSKPADEQFASGVYTKSGEVTSVRLPEKNTVRESFGSSSNVAEFDISSLMKMVHNQDYGHTPKQGITNLGFSEDSKGKFYDRYMQKRDAKLREEWGSKRAQKEAKMKAMQDSLELSRAEMKARYAGSVDRQDSDLHARRRAEKLRSFNVHSAAKNREQPIESVLSEEDGDLSEFSEQTPYGQERLFSDTILGDSSSRSIQSKRLVPNRNLSITPRTSAAPVPRSSGKGSNSNSNSGRRRTQLENPLAQSVPNFSDFRKENTKPSSGISKTTNRTQFRNYARSKSTSEELPLVKEDKPRRSQSMRKSSANSGELKDMPSLNSDSIVLTPLRFPKEQIELNLYNKIPKNGESKPFLRKGNGIGPGAGAGIAKLKASMAPENSKNEEESDELADQPEDSVVDMVIEDEEEGEGEEESGMVTGEEALEAVDFPVDSDSEKPRLSQETEKSGDPGSENGEDLRSLSQVDAELVAEIAAEAPSSFHTSVGPVQDSPGESPASWNSHMHHPFSYMHETSDIDASVDSPMGSPASWNSHSLIQMESDAARMRKKWGNAQKPILVANASHHQSRKDVTKGFKRLLKFGRKSRGTESLVDWISATTSEGDDDSEDIRDPANRSSEDLRKSRMGFSQGHHSYDGFNDGELFNEQVHDLRSSIPAPPANFRLRDDQLSGSSLKAPRSFFSFSSFRSKGSESKPR